MSGAHQPGTVAELVELLAAGGPRRVRLCGGGSRQRSLPPLPPDAARLSLQKLDRIERLEPDDLTCSVQAGVPRAALDDALRPHQLELACAGGGSLGGLFASDPIGPLSPGGPSPRSLLLGLDAVLGSGQQFKSGARVVKSVAGFDLHKLFVGSRGKLFAATTLHLKLRKAPRASACFGTAPLAVEPALRLFEQLRLLPVPPAALPLRCVDGSCTLRGRVAGRANSVAATLRQQALPEVADGGFEYDLSPAPGQELLHGSVRPSRLPALLAALPAAATMLLHGGGRFAVTLPAASTDALMAALPMLGAHAVVADGADGRIGRSTPLDPGAERLQRALIAALDPAGVLV